MAGPRHRHPDNVLRLARGVFLLLGVDPRAVFPNIRHVEEVLVDARFSQRVSEQRLMRPRGAGGDHDPIEPLVPDRVGDRLGGIRRAGEQALLGMNDIAQRARVLDERRHVDHAADIGAAATDEDADLGLVLCVTSFSAGYTRSRVSLPRRDLSSWADSAPAALAVTTDSGMSRGPWKAPLMKIPGRVVSIGFTGFVLQNPCGPSSTPNFLANSFASAGGFSPTDNTTRSNSSSLTPSSPWRT